jgi:hypothetical protein
MNGFSLSIWFNKVIEVYYYEEYENNDSEDYTLLVLDRRIGDYTGYFSIKQFSRESLTNWNINLYVYRWNAWPESVRAFFIEIDTDVVASVCMSVDGRWIVSVSEDKTLRIWS